MARDLDGPAAAQAMDGTGVTIRDARPDDGPQLVPLLGQLGYPSDHEQVARRLGRMHSPEDRLLLAVVRDALAGLLMLHEVRLLHQDGAIFRISALVVDERHRQRGIGARLMEAAEHSARCRGGARLELTSGEQRLDAHRFYQRLGFVVQSKRFIKVLGAQDPLGVR